MKKGVKLLLILLLFLSVAVLMTGCGGGSSGGTTGETGTISGTVSGTTVIAVNENGDIVASDYTTGVGKLADVNGNYPFTLKNIPAGEKIRIFLIEAGGVYPMYFENNSSSVNVFSLAVSGDINLGFVGRRNGRAVPEHNPTGYSGVSVGSAVSGMPSSISNPHLPTNTSLSGLVKAGKIALSNWWFKKANNYFTAAVGEISSSDQSEDANSARFFYALASLSAFSTDIRSGSSAKREPSDMNSPGDMLDEMGCTGGRENFDDVDCPKSLPGTTPSGGDVQTFLYSHVKPKIEDAISKLGNITDSSFSTTWVEPFGKKQVDVDYGDVLMLKAALEEMAAAIDYQYAYNLDANIATEVNYPDDIETFLSNNISFLTYYDDTTHSSALSDAKTKTVAMLDDFNSAIDTISKETDDQSNDLITLPSTTTQEDITDAEAKITKIKNCINSDNQKCTIQDHGTSDTSDDIILDMSIPFSGISIRELLPSFSGNAPNSLFPEPPLDGFVVQPSDYMNKDVSPKDGIPDILQGICFGGCK